jgi:archaellum biogenesis protein FlaJ (TadC family)
VEGVYSQAVESAPMSAVQVFSFSFKNVHMLSTLVIPVILALAGANAFAIKAADGGNRYKLYNYLAVTLGISGAMIVFVPIMAERIFSSIPKMAS